jgi:Ca2+-binding RTX toxin-like protein
MPNYRGVIVFGDSLVDAGNALGLAEWYDGLPFTEEVDAAPTADKGYYDGRFTDGFTFADLIANKYLSLPTAPIFPYEYKDPWLNWRIAPFEPDPQGNNLNFAYGGGQIEKGDEAVPDFDQQVDAWIDAVDGNADPDALHIVVFGANDVHDLVPKRDAWVDLATATAILTHTASEFISEILDMVEAGAKHLLVTGVPDIGIQPYYNDLADEAQRRAIATQYAQMLDDMIRARIEALKLPSDVQLTYVSFDQMADYVIGTLDDLYPASQIYPLYDSSIVFFDKVHPTAELHAMAAAYLLDQLNHTSSGDVLPLKAADYTRDGSIGVTGETDTVIISLAANTTYTLQMLGISSLDGDVSVLADPLLRVTAPGGSLLGSNDDGGAGLDSSFTFTTTLAGDYVVSLTGVGSMTGTYRFQAEGTAAGDNVYNVSHASAVILERAGEGYDTVRASVSYALQSDASIEVLRTSADGGTGSINLIGNGLAQWIVGNAGSNVIDGKGGADDLWGLSGKDYFLFSSPLGSGNVDRIHDYNVRDDTVRLDDSVFAGLTVGSLPSGAFARGTAASQADDRIIYDPASGHLYFDPDGVGGAAQILFAALNSGLKVTSADFIVV